MDKLNRKPIVAERWVERARDTSIDVTLFMGCLPDEITFKKGEPFNLAGAPDGPTEAAHTPCDGAQVQIGTDDRLVHAFLQDGVI